MYEDRRTEIQDKAVICGLKEGVISGFRSEVNDICAV